VDPVEPIRYPNSGSAGPGAKGHSAVAGRCPAGRGRLVARHGDLLVPDRSDQH
jgi:hypothetical protein